MSSTTSTRDRLRAGLTVGTYVLSTLVFGFGGAMVGGFLGMGSGHDGLSSSGMESGARSGALLGGICGLLIASRARRYTSKNAK